MNVEARALPIYLDHNATTPVDPTVVEAMLPFLEHHFGNPSSSHRYGDEPRRAIDIARAHVARLLDAAPGEVVWTSGGTESNALAIYGAVRAMPGRASTSSPSRRSIRPCWKRFAICNGTQLSG